MDNQNIGAWLEKFVKFSKYIATDIADAIEERHQWTTLGHLKNNQCTVKALRACKLGLTDCYCIMHGLASYYAPNIVLKHRNEMLFHYLKVELASTEDDEIKERKRLNERYNIMVAESFSPRLNFRKQLYMVPALTVNHDCDERCRLKRHLLYTGPQSVLA
mmetsp:Transcript_5686/g.6169  ORF Transcript_5686/g.6169 Transcript_5686/m.6169 type:complete len:161 (-) Transcript_5686:1-483(-)